MSKKKIKSEKFSLEVSDLRCPIFLIHECGRLVLPSDKSQDEMMNIKEVESVEVSLCGYCVVLRMKESEFTKKRLSRVKKDIASVLNAHGFELGV